MDYVLRFVDGDNFVNFRKQTTPQTVCFHTPICCHMSALAFLLHFLWFSASVFHFRKIPD